MQLSTIKATPVSPYLGAEISGIDLNKKLSDAQIDDLQTAFAEYQVIFFRDQKLDYDALRALGRCFGELFIHPNSPGPEGHPEITLLHADSNSDRIIGERWHSDASCDPTPPLGSILYLHTVPPVGGDTCFASQYAAYDDLSDRMKIYLEGLTAMHDGTMAYRDSDLARGRYKPGKAYPWAMHPVVVTHPITKRKALFVNGNFTVRINELPETESAGLLRFLCEHAVRTDFQIRFHWRPHSIAFWDNRCLQHLAVWDYYPHTRSGFRVTVKGEKPAA
jgi:taurine dioxygenase